MSEEHEFKGRIVKVGQIKSTKRPGLYRLPLLIATDAIGEKWFGIFGTTDGLETIAQKAQKMPNCSGVFKEDGDFNNIEPEDLKFQEGMAPPPARKEAPVHEERLGVEDQEAEEDRHYAQAWARAGRIAGADLQFRLALFDKLASPLVYLRENIRKARQEAGVR